MSDITELEQKRLERDGFTIMLNVTVNRGIEWFEWQPEFVLDQLKRANMTPAMFAHDLRAIAKQIEERC